MTTVKKVTHFAWQNFHFYYNLRCIYNTNDGWPPAVYQHMYFEQFEAACWILFFARIDQTIIDNSHTTYNTVQRDFAEVLAKFYSKSFPYFFNTEKFLKYQINNCLEKIFRTALLKHPSLELDTVKFKNYNIDSVKIGGISMVQQRQTYHHKDLRNALIETGIKIVSTEGINAFSLRKVAAVCGVSHAAPYSHFQNKMKNCLKQCNYLSQIDFQNN